MDINRPTRYIDTQNLINLSKGNEARMLKYLVQFQELIPLRIEKLRSNLREDNRLAVRQILHQMSPQLQFFGVPGILKPIQCLEVEYETISALELNKLVADLLIKLDGAVNEVTLIIKS
jgi:hypothetical protein